MVVRGRFGGFDLGDPLGMTSPRYRRDVEGRSRSGRLLSFHRMPTSPPTQYADDRNLRARQRIWS